MMRIKSSILGALIFGAFLLTAPMTMAGDLTVQATNDKGEPLENAVVSLTPKFQPAQPMPTPEVAEMRQQNTLFAPFVLPVRTGTNVSFPNFDEARHHVYSFSKARRFELRLYGMDESRSIEFDTAGVVALGCNIHDNMLAYIYVTDAPIYKKTDADGRVSLLNLEDGQYDIDVWHPGQRGNGAPETMTVDIGETPTELTLPIRLRRVWGQQRPPADGQY